MSDEQQQPANKRQPSKLEQLDKLLGVVYAGLVLVIYLDVVTHGRVRLYGRALVERARSRAFPAPVEPSPAELSAMLREAETILEEGAHDA